MNSVETIFTIVLMIGIGYGLRKLGILKVEDSVTLNKIVVNLAIPSLIFLAMYTSNLSKIHLIAPIPFICIFVGVLCGVLAYIFTKIANYPKKTRWSIILTSAMVNSGFLGYPVVMGVFGEEGLIRAIFYDLGSVVLFILFGILLLLMLGGRYSEIAKKVFLFPPLWGVIFGILANFLKIDIGL